MLKYNLWFTSKQICIEYPFKAPPPKKKKNKKKNKKKQKKKKKKTYKEQFEKILN